MLDNPLFDFDWMYDKLMNTDSASLLVDAVTAVEAFPNDHELRLIEAALRLSKKPLSQDKKQLANQLRGRLWIYKDNTQEYPAITTLWRAISAAPGTLNLLPTQQLPPMKQAGTSLLQSVNSHTNRVQGVLQLSNGYSLSWSDDGTLKLWTPDGAPLTTFQGHKKAVRGALERTDKLILSWSEDSTLRLWNSERTSVTIFQGHTDVVHSALELTDHRILSWSWDGTLRLWTQGGDPMTTLQGHIGRVEGAVELSDQRILSWANDPISVSGALKLWAEDGTPLTTLNEHTKLVNGALELEDGRILSWSIDRTLRLWTKDGNPLATLEGHTGWVQGALQLVDKRIVSWCSDPFDPSPNTLRLWTSDGVPLTVLEARYYDSSDREKIFSWAHQNHFDASEIFIHDPELSADWKVDWLGERSHVQIYDSTNGRTLGRFIGETHFSKPVVHRETQTIIVGDADGHVVFLKFIPPSPALNPFV
jgi:hypothetical protein